MATALLVIFILAWALCVSTAEALWFRRYDTSHQSQAWQSEELAAAASLFSSQSYTFLLPTPTAIEAAVTSQGMVVSSIIPIYEVCQTSGAALMTCSTLFEMLISTKCSTVLTYAFTQATVSDCSQNITFSTQSSYSLVTATASPTVTPALLNQPPAITTYIESLVSYYIAPWQALAANKPSNVTVLVCKYDPSGDSTCTTIQEIWVVRTVDIPAITTSTLVISTTLPSPAVLLLGPNERITATAGPLYISTEIVYSSMAPNVTTSISTILPTSTTVETLTVTSTLPPRTITITLSSVTPAPEPTTTLFSTTLITSTVTVHPIPRL